MTSSPAARVLWDEPFELTPLSIGLNPESITPLPDGFLVVGSFEGAVGLERYDLLGRAKWRRLLVGRARSSSFGIGARVLGGQVVVGIQSGSDGQVVAVDAADGRLRWTHNLPGPLSAVETDGISVYALTTSALPGPSRPNAVIRLAGDTGLRQWRRELTVGPLARSLQAPAGGNGVFLASSGDVTKLFKGSGTVAWTQSGYSDNLRATPDGTLYVNNPANDLVRLSPTNGAAVWTQPGISLVGTAENDPLVADSTGLQRQSRATGATVWSTPTPAGSYLDSFWEGLPGVFGEVLGDTGSSGLTRLSLINLADGTRTRLTPNLALPSTTIVLTGSEANFFFAGKAGILDALRMRRGDWTTGNLVQSAQTRQSLLPRPQGSWTFGPGPDGSVAHAGAWVAGAPTWLSLRRADGTMGWTVVPGPFFNRAALAPSGTDLLAMLTRAGVTGFNATDGSVAYTRSFAIEANAVTAREDRLLASFRTNDGTELQLLNPATGATSASKGVGTASAAALLPEGVAAQQFDGTWSLASDLSGGLISHPAGWNMPTTVARFSNGSVLQYRTENVMVGLGYEPRSTIARLTVAGTLGWTVSELSGSLPFMDVHGAVLVGDVLVATVRCVGEEATRTVGIDATSGVVLWSRRLPFVLAPSSTAGMVVEPGGAIAVAGTEVPAGTAWFSGSTVGMRVRVFRITALGVWGGGEIIGGFEGPMARFSSLFRAQNGNTVLAYLRQMPGTPASMLQPRARVYTHW